MVRVFAMHGIVRKADPARFVHRNMEDWDRFETHLRARKDPFVTLSDALKGKGDALTIDDATLAGADAAHMAREHGHEVTFFVNPWNVVEGKMYIHAYLNTLLDGIVKDTFSIRERLVPVKTAQEKKMFRMHFKQYLNAILSLEKQESIVRVRAVENEIPLIVPEYLHTISLERLQELAHQGVHIRNHGWQHVHHEAFSAEEKVANLEKGRAWLRTVFSITDYDYAIPFGVEHRLATSPTGGTWYLLDSGRPRGFVGNGLLNRIPIVV